MSNIPSYLAGQMRRDDFYFYREPSPILFIFPPYLPPKIFISIIVQISHV